MRLRTWFVGFWLSWLALVWIKDGTAPKLLNDLNKGAQDVVGGLKQPAGLA